MDDTLENLLDAWVDYLNHHYGTTVQPSDIKQWDVSRYFPTLSKEQVFSPLYTDEFWYSVEPIDGAVEAMQKLKRDGHDVIVVTASAYQTLRAKMDSVLFKYFPFINWDDVIVTNRKQLIRGDVLIDDGIHNLEGGDYEKILMDAPTNQWYNEKESGMTRVNNWDMIYKKVCEIANVQ